METIKKVAVYMDHFMANIIEYTKSAEAVKTIKSEFNRSEKKKFYKKVKVSYIIKNKICS